MTDLADERWLSGGCPSSCWPDRRPRLSRRRVRAAHRPRVRRLSRAPGLHRRRPRRHAACPTSRFHAPRRRRRAANRPPGADAPRLGRDAQVPLGRNRRDANCLVEAGETFAAATEREARSGRLAALTHVPRRLRTCITRTTLRSTQKTGNCGPSRPPGFSIQRWPGSPWCRRSRHGYAHRRESIQRTMPESTNPSGQEPPGLSRPDRTPHDVRRESGRPVLPLERERLRHQAGRHTARRRSHGCSRSPPRGSSSQPSSSRSSREAGSYILVKSGVIEARTDVERRGDRWTANGLQVCENA